MKFEKPSQNGEGRRDQIYRQIQRRRINLHNVFFNITFKGCFILFPWLMILESSEPVTAGKLHLKSLKWCLVLFIEIFFNQPMSDQGDHIS